jgi:WD40 repeat protein
MGAVTCPEKYLATGSVDKTARRDITTGQASIFAGHTDEVLGVTFSPDGKYINDSKSYKTTGMWDVATGQT